MYSYPADYLIIWGLRTVLALVGMLTTFVGYWKMEAKWDDQGSVAARQATGDMEAGNYKKMTESQNQQASKSETSTTSNVSQTALDDALPMNMILLAGQLIWATSFLFSPRGGFGLQISAWNIICTIKIVVLAFVMASPLRIATKRRDMKLKRKAVFTMLFCWLLIAIAGIVEGSTHAPWYFTFLGVFFIVTSYFVMWKYRKMGESWDLYGRANEEFVVPNLGVFFFVLGFIWLFIGTNAVVPPGMDPTAAIPIFTSSERGWVAALGTFLIVSLAFARDFAWDCGSKPDGYGLDGSTFARIQIPYLGGEQILAQVIEGPVLYLLGWLVMGLVSFLPFWGRFDLQQVFSLIACLAIVILETFIVQPSFWSGDQERFQKVTHWWYLSLAFWAMIVGIHGGPALAMAVVAVVLVAVGRKWSLLDARRGTYWLEQEASEGTENPQASVYGFGYAAFSAGMVLFSLAMTIPMY